MSAKLLTNGKRNGVPQQLFLPWSLALPVHIHCQICETHQYRTSLWHIWSHICNTVTARPHDEALYVTDWYTRQLVPQTMALTAIHCLYKNPCSHHYKTKSLQWKQRRYSRPPLISMQLMASNSLRRMKPRDRSSALISSESIKSIETSNFLAQDHNYGITRVVTAYWEEVGLVTSSHACRTGTECQGSCDHFEWTYTALGTSHQTPRRELHNRKKKGII